MKLPLPVLIPRRKLTHYLLVPREVDDKARFLAQAGFTQANPEVLEAALQNWLKRKKRSMDLSNDYGDFYRVDGQLDGPSGTLAVVTIWIVQTNIDGRFRFVTLKPLRK